MPTQTRSDHALRRYCGDCQTRSAVDCRATRPRSTVQWLPLASRRDCDRKPARRAKRSERIAVVTAAQERIEGTVIGQISTDVALIRVGTTAQAVVPAPADNLAVGELVVAVGRARHGALCSVGSIALAEGPWRSMHGGDISARVWLDMRSAAEAEGAAVFNAGGRFIGMAVHAPRRRVLADPGGHHRPGEPGAACTWTHPARLSRRGGAGCGSSG